MDLFLTRLGFKDDTCLRPALIYVTVLFTVCVCVTPMHVTYVTVQHFFTFSTLSTLSALYLCIRNIVTFLSSTSLGTTN